MHFKQHEEDDAKYVTSEANIGQTFVWPFMIQVSFLYFLFFFFFKTFLLAKLGDPSWIKWGKSIAALTQNRSSRELHFEILYSGHIKHSIIL